ncbi:hypothetical protein PUN28_018262 [Cardiocondyla obscurior]|uniref:Uncharacterized protein n=1 Tax=Cardiocondyla obscurior TaxID=286306 RepID=A0AAW2EKH0_9HYME
MRVILFSQIFRIAASFVSVLLLHVTVSQFYDDKDSDEDAFYCEGQQHNIYSKSRVQCNHLLSKNPLQSPLLLVTGSLIDAIFLFFFRDYIRNNPNKIIRKIIEHYKNCSFYFKIKIIRCGLPMRKHTLVSVSVIAF